jgi:hypothetical protein
MKLVLVFFSLLAFASAFELPKQFVQSLQEDYESGKFRQLQACKPCAGSESTVHGNGLRRNRNLNDDWSHFSENILKRHLGLNYDELWSDNDHGLRDLFSNLPEDNNDLEMERIVRNMKDLQQNVREGSIQLEKLMHGDDQGFRNLLADFHFGGDEATLGETRQLFWDAAGNMDTALEDLFTQGLYQLFEGLAIPGNETITTTNGTTAVINQDEIIVRISETEQMILAILLPLLAGFSYLENILSFRTFVQILLMPLFALANLLRALARTELSLAEILLFLAIMPIATIEWYLFAAPFLTFQTLLTGETIERLTEGFFTWMEENLPKLVLLFAPMNIMLDEAFEYMESTLLNYALVSGQVSATSVSNEISSLSPDQVSCQLEVTTCQMRGAALNIGHRYI